MGCQYWNHSAPGWYANNRFWFGISYFNLAFIVSAAGGVALKLIFAASRSTGLKLEIMSIPPFPVVSFWANETPNEKIPNPNKKNLYKRCFVISFVFLFRPAGRHKFTKIILTPCCPSGRFFRLSKSSYVLILFGLQPLSSIIFYLSSNYSLYLMCLLPQLPVPA